MNINLVAFGAFWGTVSGQVFALFIIAVAAAEVGVGLGIVLMIYRNRATIDLETARPDEGVSARHDVARAALAQQGAREAADVAHGAGWILEHAWLFPLIPFVSFLLILGFGKQLKYKGAELGVAALAACFVLSLGAGYQWIRYVDDVNAAGSSRARGGLGSPRRGTGRVRRRRREVLHHRGHRVRRPRRPSPRTMAPRPRRPPRSTGRAASRPRASRTW